MSNQQKEFPGLGLVETQYAQLCKEGLTLDSGVTIGPLTVAYETYGKLNSDRDNTIVVCHALSGGAHAAGFSADAKKPCLSIHAPEPENLHLAEHPGCLGE